MRGLYNYYGNSYLNLEYVQSFGIFERKELYYIGFDMQNGARYETDVMNYQVAKKELENIINNNLK